MAESGATLIALTLAILGGVRNRQLSAEDNRLRKAERDRELQREAEAVSALVTDVWLPDPDRNTYKRLVELHVTNQGPYPVFEVEVSVEIGLVTKYSIGPLSAPNKIPTLPAVSTLTWDISVPFFAFEDTAEPRASLLFRSQSGVQWERRADGRLIKEPPLTSALWYDDESRRESGDAKSIGELQLGSLETPSNPMAITFAFLSVLTDDPDNINRDELYQFTAPEADGWKKTSDEELTSLARQLAKYGPATFVHYPAPQVAYVRVPLIEPTADKMVPGGGKFLPAQVLTLTFHSSRGWRVYGVGYSMSPDELRFPRNTFKR